MNRQSKFNEEIECYSNLVIARIRLREKTGEVSDSDIKGFCVLTRDGKRGIVLRGGLAISQCNDDVVKEEFKRSKRDIDREIFTERGREAEERMIKVILKQIC